METLPGCAVWHHLTTLPASRAKSCKEMKIGMKERPLTKDLSFRVVASDRGERAETSFAIRRGVLCQLLDELARGSQVGGVEPFGKLGEHRLEKRLRIGETTLRAR
jgi:hypothetical protein